MKILRGYAAMEFSLLYVQMEEHGRETIGGTCCKMAAYLSCRPTPLSHQLPRLGLGDGKAKPSKAPSQFHPIEKPNVSVVNDVKQLGQVCERML